MNNQYQQIVQEEEKEISDNSDNEQNILKNKERRKNQVNLKKKLKRIDVDNDNRDDNFDDVDYLPQHFENLQDADNTLEKKISSRLSSDGSIGIDSNLSNLPKSLRTLKNRKRKKVNGIDKHLKDEEENCKYEVNLMKIRLQEDKSEQQNLSNSNSSLSCHSEEAALRKILSPNNSGKRPFEIFVQDTDYISEGQYPPFVTDRLSGYQDDQESSERLNDSPISKGELSFNFDEINQDFGSKRDSGNISSIDVYLCKRSSVVEDLRKVSL